MNEAARVPLACFSRRQLAECLREELHGNIRLNPLQTNSAIITEPSIFRVNDQVLFKRFLSLDEYEERLHSTYKSLFLLTFALRHKLVSLSLVAHAYTLKQKRSASWPQHRAAADEILMGSIDRDVESLRDVMEPSFWRQPSQGCGSYPIFGSSAVGCHVCFSSLDRCRFVDFYENEQCTEQTDGLFCDAHSDEAWWITLNRATTVTGRMALFYFFEENAFQYDEEDLSNMVSRFWREFAHVERMTNPNPEQMEAALERFGYGDRGEILRLGNAELRRRFLSMAREKHPDVGGRTGEFVTLKSHYDVLRAILGG